MYEKLLTKKEIQAEKLFSWNVCGSLNGCQCLNNHFYRQETNTRFFCVSKFKIL